MKLLYLLMAVAVVFLSCTDNTPAKTDDKPAAETCLPIEGWTAEIEKTSKGEWACVMRSKDGRSTKAWFYGEKK